MSSPAQGGPSVPKDSGNGGDEDKKTASRGRQMLTRMKTIMKRAEKRMSISGSSKAGPSTAAVKTSEPTPAPAESSKKAVDPDVTKVPRMQLHEERARRLGERFGLEIKPSEWHSTEGDALRVEKPIRMRVHRICHKCQATFGLSKQCPKCTHARCKDCTRYPPKRTEAEKIASREKRAAMLKAKAENPPIAADWDTSDKVVTLTRPSKSGGQDLVYKKPRQRVRRHCCQCNLLFARKSKKCEGCTHKRCTDCARDPAKKKDYPYGYPGDEFGDKSIPYHECHECKTKFEPNSADGTACGNCSHSKCSDCPRLKPKKVEPELDPNILKSIEARLAKMKAS